MKPHKIPVGQTFGLLTVLGPAPSRSRRTQWECQCACGNKHITLSRYIYEGDTKSCGCLNRTRVGGAKKTHGHSVGGVLTPEYRVWLSVVRRCTSPASSNWDAYGGRGIKMCEEWRESFEQFLSDMGPRPGLQWSIERLDNEKGYFPGNCVWAERKQQARNTRSTLRLKLFGETRSFAEWVERLGEDYHKVYNQIDKARRRAAVRILKKLHQEKSQL